MSQPAETSHIDVNFSISERSFFEMRPTYATFPYVSFDGFNYHLVLFATTPIPVDNQEGPVRAQAVARIVLPPAAAMATLDALRNALASEDVQGIFKPIFDEEGEVDVRD